MTAVLEPDEVHVWRLSLDCEPAALLAFRDILSDDERVRADRFHFSRHRDHFTAGRGQLRTLLGRYLGRDPAGLCFQYNLQGKPSLPNPEGQALRFNLAHSHGLALLALSRQREVGIDVERVRPEVACEDLAGRYFSPREVAALRSLPAELRRLAFFHCWTRKEAYIKAIGKGLSLPLDSFDVSVMADEAALLEARHEDEGRRWSLCALEVPDGFVGALAVEGEGWRLRLFSGD
jgi:4'-phosphopantetheinyl transferase